MNHNRRSSGRLFQKDPVCYDEQGWEIPRTSLMQEVAALPSSSLTSGSEPIPANRQPKYSCKKQDRVLRPKNAFILFRSDFYSAQRRISNYQGQNEISRQAGRTWKGLSDEEKRPYCLLAEKEKREHRAKYPDYVYTPGSRTSRPKQKVRAGGITKICSKLQPRIRFESEELESLSSSPYPTRLSPESAESERACSHIETPQPELVENKSEDFSPKLVWASVPTESIPPLKLSVLKIEKSSEFDLSLRPPSHDYVDAPLGFKSTITPMMDVFLPTMKSSSPELDTDIDFGLFTQVTRLYTQLSSLSLATPPLHEGWNYEQQTVSSYDGKYLDIDFNRTHILESEDTDTREMFANSDGGNILSPVIRSSSITQAEEIEMSQYIDFDYDG